MAEQLRDLALMVAFNFKPEEAENIPVAEGASSSDEDSGHVPVAADNGDQDVSSEDTGTLSPTQSPVAVAIAEDEDRTVNVQERTRFLRLVQERFPAEADPYKVHGKLVGILVDFQNGKMEKFSAHHNACILLIGHADLLQDFEQLLKIGPEVYGWRFNVMAKLMRYVDLYLKSTVKEMSIKEELTAEHLYRILSFIRDPVKRNEFAAGLREADKWRTAALRSLLIRRMEDFLSSYIGQKLDYADLCDEDDP